MELKAISCLIYLIAAPILGGLLSGIDRKLSARMQGRRGPSLMQPFWDILKLREKEDVTVNSHQDFYVKGFFLFVVISGCIFFTGGDLLMLTFTLTLANVFLVVAAYSSNSAFAELGAERELLQMMAYEPMVLFTAIGFYLLKGSFRVEDIVNGTFISFPYMIGVFIGFLFILTIKFRKSPFDLSMSHHAHQELVSGLKTEFSGKTLALLELAHWYENIFLLGIVSLFFMNGRESGYILGVSLALVSFIFESFVDNSFARMKYQAALKYSWIVTITLGFFNICVLSFMR